jgi:hypothetical protein
MFAIPNFLIFHPFQKAYVKQHMRNGKEIGPYFTKRPPAKVKEKHLTERFIDHSEASARKTHADLEKEKRQHQSIIEALKQHHDELVSKGDNTDDDGKGLSHKEKIAHLKAEIKNQETHLANKTRKQDLIKNRYEINKKQVAKRQEDSLNKKLSQYSEGQQKTIKDIHKASSEGKSKLVPGLILKGKDKDHIYLEAKHKDTGETHHIAIHQDGSLRDPQILHGGKFDSKALSESVSPKEPKKVKAKERIPENKKPKVKGRKISKPVINDEVYIVSHGKTENHDTKKEFPTYSAAMEYAKTIEKGRSAKIEFQKMVGGKKQITTIAEKGPEKKEKPEDSKRNLTVGDIPEDLKKSFKKDLAIDNVSASGYLVKDKSKFLSSLDSMRKHLSGVYDRHPVLNKKIREKNRSIRTLTLINKEGFGRNRSIGKCFSNRRNITLANEYKGAGSLRLGDGNYGVDTTFTGIYRHEIGHHYQLQDNELRDSWNKLLTDNGINPGRGGTVALGGGSTFSYEGISRDRNAEKYWTENVSKYSACNTWEAFAESFCAYTHPDYGKTVSLPKEIEAFFDKHVGKKS